MDANITQYLSKRRVEMVYFPVIVFGYLATINQTRIYLILTLIATITSPIAFHWVVREFGGIDPTETDRNPGASLIQNILIQFTDKSYYITCSYDTTFDNAHIWSPRRVIFEFHIR